MDHLAIEIRALTVADAMVYRACRLRALRDHPDAFGMSYEEEAARPIEHTIERLEQRHAALDNFILGAFRADHLIGTAGLFRNESAKTRHKATIWGVYTVPDMRAQRIGRRLIEAVLDRARQIDGLEQVQLAVTTTNDAARTLYERLGFVAYGVERHALKLPDRYVDEMYMTLFLEP